MSDLKSENYFFPRKQCKSPQLQLCSHLNTLYLWSLFDVLNSSLILVFFLSEEKTSFATVST